MSDVWSRIGNLETRLLTNYLKNEYPQTVAIILIHLEEDVAAKVLAMLPESFALEVVMRIGRIDLVSDRAMKIVERVLQETLERCNSGVYSGSVEFLGGVFSRLPQEAQERFLKATGERSKDFAEQISNAMGGR